MDTPYVYTVFKTAIMGCFLTRKKEFFGLR